jgi:hypothetical protein
MSADAVSITGGCFCKAVRFRATAAPITVRVCWCRDCQYLGAGSGTVNVTFHTSAFAIEAGAAELRNYTSIAKSGNRMHRRFCGICGTPLFSEAEVRPHLMVVRAGALDDPEIAQPALTIWTSTAPTWACFDPEVPQVEGQPPPAA